MPFLKGRLLQNKTDSWTNKSDAIEAHIQAALAIKPGNSTSPPNSNGDALEEKEIIERLVGHFLGAIDMKTQCSKWL